MSPRKFKRTWKTLTEAQLLAALTEDSVTQQEALDRVGLSHTTFYRLTEFRTKYKKELREASRKRYAVSKLGNMHGKTEQPATVLDKEELQNALHRGIRFRDMMQMFNCSEYLLIRNMRYHELTFIADETNRVPYLLRGNYLHILEKLELFQPGLCAVAKRMTEEPEAFFKILHSAHLKLLEAQWAVRYMGRRSQYYTGKSEGWCWNQNRYEARLALALEAASLPYRREVALKPGRAPMRIDFLIDDRLFVEVDGPYHQTPEGRAYDHVKETLVLKTKVPLLRFSESRVWRRTNDVLLEIQQKLPHCKHIFVPPVSNVSNPLVSKKSGISLSKRMKAI